MKTAEILKTQLTGNYHVQITLENHNAPNEGIEFKNLGDAIAYANGLTFAKCQVEMSHTENDVRGYNEYDVSVFLSKDFLGYPCVTEGGRPLLYTRTVYWGK